MAATDSLSPAQFSSPHPHGGDLWYSNPDAQPRCTTCGHRTKDPVTGELPGQTRSLGPKAWAVELPMRAVAKRQGAA